MDLQSAPILGKWRIRSWIALPPFNSLHFKRPTLRAPPISLITQRPAPRPWGLAHAPGGPGGEISRLLQSASAGHCCTVTAGEEQRETA